MTELKDWSLERGVATEDHWDKFVKMIGGTRVANFVSRPKFNNADYLIPNANVVIELKVLETEFARQPELKNKIDLAVADFEKYPPSSDALADKVLELLRHPLARIAKKANKQVRETKLHMDLKGWKGLFICINDGFRQFPPQLVEHLFHRVLHGSCSSIASFVYMTNHYIELPGNPYALELWSPRYREPIDHELVSFVNKLGVEWGKYTESVLGPYDWSGSGQNFDISNARVVTGPIRHYRTENDQ